MFGFGAFMHQIRIKILAVDMVSQAVKKSISSLERLRYTAIAITDASRRLMILGVALAGLFALPIQQAVQFDYGMVQIRRTTQLAFGDIKSGITALVDKQIPETIEGFLNIARMVGRAGVTGKKNVFSLTETIAKLTAVTDLTADQSAEAMIRFAKAFHVPYTEIERLGSVVNELAKTTASSESDIVEGLRRIGKPIDSLTFQQLAALQASLTALNVPRFIAGTGQRNIFTRMLANAKNLAPVMKMSMEDWVGYVEKDAMGALLALAEQLKALPTAERVGIIKTNLGSRELLSIQALINNLDFVKERIDIANRAFRENASLSRDVALLQASPWSKLLALWNNLRLLVIEFGGVFLGVLVVATDHLIKMARGVREFIKEHPRVIGLVGAFVAFSAVGSIVTSVLLKMVASAISVAVAFAMMDVVLEGVKVHMLGVSRSAPILGTAWSRLSSGPLMGLIARLGPLAGLLAIVGAWFWIVYRNSKRLRDEWDALKNSIDVEFAPALNTIGYSLGMIFGAILNVTDALGITSPSFDDAGNSIAGVISPTNTLMRYLLDFSKFLINLFNPALMVTAYIFQTISEFVSLLVTEIGLLVDVMWKLANMDFSGAYTSFRKMGEAMRESGANQKSFLQGLRDYFVTGSPVLPMPNVPGAGGPVASMVGANGAPTFFPGMGFDSSMTTGSVASMTSPGALPTFFPGMTIDSSMLGGKKPSMGGAKLTPTNVTKNTTKNYTTNIQSGAIVVKTDDGKQVAFNIQDMLAKAFAEMGEDEDGDDDS